MVKEFLRKKNFCASGVFFLTLLFCRIAIAAPNFTAKLDRDVISLGESATLSTTFTDVSSHEPPQVPSVQNLSIDYSGQSSQVEIVNNSMSSTLTHTFEVTPHDVGNFVIPAIQVQINGKTFFSQPLHLKVLKAQETTGDKSAFLKLIVQKNEIYVGETIPVEVRLYCQDARDLTMPQLQGEGFTIGSFPQPTQTRTRFGNEIYNLVTFKMPVAATKTGTLNLGPATCGLKILTGPRDFFGQFTQAKQVTLTSEPQTMHVLPLPEANKPAEFNGAIGNFSMSFQAAPTNVAVGDPITLKIKISGRGSLDSISLPAQSDWRDFKLYPATSKVEPTDALGLEGAKTFEQVVVAENSSVHELPSFRFSFFNPQTKKYQTLSSAVIPLVVRPTAATPQPTVFANNSENVEPQTAPEVLRIKPELGTVSAISAPLVTEPWFLALQGIAPLIWIGSVFVRKRKENFENNPKLRRRREVDQTVSRGLKELSEHASANDSEKFFALTFRLLQEQIGERLDLPASAITEMDVEAKLRRLELDEETLSVIRELFQACNQARYAKQRSREELALFIPKVRKAIDGLRKIK